MVVPRTLADVPTWWLRVRCRCGRSTHLSPVLLPRRHGRRILDVPLERLVTQLKCQECGGRVTEVDVAEDPRAGARKVPGSDRIPSFWVKAPER